ncbi:hypothetical protein FDP41_007276 [Naegleria fowleri]|uniref:glycerol-3-phosphate dehydrogenase n=1 Tax=Naegleria fowleri TaxID=5763 RepID=A0A6A5BLV1_NAEFO|nr:uncharacterized protein FDP41_007276 [Naegleria fowleri]KAF0973889.1 hypothetical protein FDP41_007276 [Naegleria fowleri]CAG4711084.1 unnamed protein product [Naegleria fowleri]
MKQIFRPRNLFLATAIVGGGLFSVNAILKSKHNLYEESGNSLLKAFDRKALFEHQATEQLGLPRDSEGQVILHTDRAENLNVLENQSPENEFDVIIVGGGSVGASAALDACTRGMKVVVLERNDFASGTSSRATKMAHGGVRYLEKAVMNLDWNELMLVYECLRERKHFFQVAPHLSSPLKLLTPCYSLYDSLRMYIGLTLYDMLSGFEARLGYSGWVSKARSLELWPSLKKEGLYGCMSYYDGVFNDSRMNISTILTANALGALTLNYMEVVDLIKSEENNKIIGVKARDRINGKEYSIRGRCVVNATGPFVDQLRKMDDPNCVPIISPSTGTHITFDLDKFTSGIGKKMGVLFPKTSDGRVLYLVPWEGKLIAGTTDTPSTLTERPSPTNTDIDFIMSTMKTCLTVPLSTSDITSSWTGIRPLVKPVAVAFESTKTLSRDHHIETSSSNLVTVAGGKWTSFRKIGEDTIDTVISVRPDLVGLLAKPISRTYYTPLIGASYQWEALKNIKQSPSEKVSNDSWEHLKHFYGDRAPYIVQLSETNGLTQLLSPKYPFIEGEVLYQAKYEMAVKPSDIIAYRLSLMFIDRNESKQVAKRVVDIMGDYHQWNDETRRKHLEETLAYIDVCTK